MSKKDDLETILTNQEIEPNNPYDISMRKTPNSVIPRFRGLAGQITVNPDDMYRPYVWLNKNLGEHYELVLTEDFKTPKYTYKAVNVSRQVHEITVDQNVTVDSSVAGVWKIKYTNNISIFFKLEDTPSEVTVILQSANPFARVTFVDADLNWVGSAPNIKGDSGTLFAFHFYRTALGIVGEVSRDTSQKSTATITPVLQAYTSLGYGLPAGTSGVGVTGEKYELLSGIAEYSADDLYNIGKVASSINHVEKVAGLENLLPVIVANATSITTLAAVANLLVENLTIYKTVANNSASILNVHTNLPAITSIEGKLTELETVKDNLTSISALAPLATTLQTLADNIEKITKVYDEIIAKEAENTEPTEGA